MHRRLRILAICALWLSPAAVTVELASCNDGSTGCCMICECACGDECMIDCSMRCTKPKGCACSSNMPEKSALEAPRSLATDAAARE